MCGCALFYVINVTRTWVLHHNNRTLPGSSSPILYRYEGGSRLGQLRCNGCAGGLQEYRNPELTTTTVIQYLPHTGSHNPAHSQ